MSSPFHLYDLTDGGTGLCGELEARYWVQLTWAGAILVAMAAFAFALAGSTFARRASIAGLIGAGAVVVMGALVSFHVVGAGAPPISDEVRDFYKAEYARRSTPESLAKWREDEAQMAIGERNQCLVSSAGYALFPMAIALAGLGLVALRMRAKRDEASRNMAKRDEE